MPTTHMRFSQGILPEQNLSRGPSAHADKTLFQEEICTGCISFIHHGTYTTYSYAAYTYR